MTRIAIGSRGNGRGPSWEMNRGETGKRKKVVMTEAKEKKASKKKEKRETNNSAQCCHSAANSITGSTLSQGLQYTPSSDSIAPDIPSISEMK